MGFLKNLLFFKAKALTNMYSGKTNKHITEAFTLLANKKYQLR